MQVSWWAAVVIGAIVLGVGIYTVAASQNEINYVKSCEKPVACGTAGSNPTPKFFLSSSLITSMEQAQIAWALGLVALGLGLVSLSYGVYLYLQGRPGASAVQTAMTPP